MLAVAERRRGRQRGAVVGLEEPRFSLPERREGSVEPGVAEERRLFEPLCGNERGGRCARAGGDRLERPPFRAREPVCRRRQLLEQPPQRCGEERQLRGVTRRPLGQRRRLGRLERRPRRSAAASSAAGVAVRREGQSVSSSSAVNSPRPANDGLPGKEPIDDQLGRRDLLGVGEREHVEELELVVEVVLEPEHHLQVVAERLEQLPVAPLERGEQRLPASPAAVGEEAGAGLQQLLARQRRHRPLVEHVLPGQHGAAECGLPERIAGAFAVRDVEERRPRRRRPAARAR